MSIRILAEKILSRNIKERLQIYTAQQTSAHIKNDLFDNFKASSAWTSQLEHLVKELDALEPEILATLEKEFDAQQK